MIAVAETDGELKPEAMCERDPDCVCTWTPRYRMDVMSQLVREKTTMKGLADSALTVYESVVVVRVTAFVRETNAATSTDKESELHILTSNSNSIVNFESTKASTKPSQANSTAARAFIYPDINNDGLALPFPSTISRFRPEPDRDHVSEFDCSSPIATHYPN